MVLSAAGQHGKWDSRLPAWLLQFPAKVEAHLSAAGEVLALRHNCDVELIIAPGILGELVVVADALDEAKSRWASRLTYLGPII